MTSPAPLPLSSAKVRKFYETTKFIHFNWRNFMQESTGKNFPKVYTFMYTIIRDPTTENKFYYIYY